MVVRIHPGQLMPRAFVVPGLLVLALGMTRPSAAVAQIADARRDTSVIEAAIVAGGYGAEAFMGLIEGGKDGAFYQDLESYFCYSQLRSDGERNSKPRTMDGHVQLQEVPNLMRALGFYPTEKEIENMLSEVRYSEVRPSCA